MCVCVCVWIIKIGRLNTLIFGMDASINMYVDFTLIFDKFDGIYIYIYMWIFKVGKFKYINIWQVLSQKKEKKEKKKAGCLE